MASFYDFTILHPQDHHSGIIQDGRVARECGISTMPQGEARLIGCIDLSPEWKGIINYNAITVPTPVCWLPIPKAIEISWKDVLSLIVPLLPFIINGPHITRSGQMLPCTGSRKQRSPLQNDVRCRCVCESKHYILIRANIPILPSPGQWWTYTMVLLSWRTRMASHPSSRDPFAPIKGDHKSVAVADSYKIPLHCCRFVGGVMCHSRVSVQQNKTANCDISRFPFLHPSHSLLPFVRLRWDRELGCRHHEAIER